MSEGTKIEWATHTWNPWEGCTKVSPGCANCYAEVRNKRFRGGANWGKGKPRRRTAVANWRLPLRWNKEAKKREEAGLEPGQHYERPRIFPSLCDWLDDEVPIEWLADFLKLIHDTPSLDWLLLTKRPENMERINTALALFNPGQKMWTLGGLVPHNVWIGVSVEDQQRADERIPELLIIPAKVRFLSAEPLLEDIDLVAAGWNGDESNGNWCSWCGGFKPRHGPHDCYDPKCGVDWVIVGGESGPSARVCNLEWVRSVVGQCKSAAVPCFVKQLGTYVRAEDTKRNGSGTSGFCDISLKHSKGGDPSEWPEDLRVREFPHEDLTAH